MEFNSLPGTLRWTDLPDPPRETPVASRANARKKVETPEQIITSRKKIEIPEQMNLQLALTDNGFRYKNEMIQESYSFVRENVEFVFSRYYLLPASPGRSVTTMPPWAELRPLDSAQKWVLNVKLNVSDDSQPEKVKDASDELLAVKAELDKLFDFKAVDRKVFDTRIAPPPARVIPGN
ncbi:hypothetical protein Hte_003561 [Hypoxylon texense]